jgi:hypothetical protein
MKRFMSIALLAAAATASGCGGDKPYNVVAVSGQVLLDGQPLPDAYVLFRPQAGAAQSKVGPDAYGRTDAQGNFNLTTVFDEEGATAGRNLVSITTLQVQENPTDPDNGRARQVLTPEKVPPRYNRTSELYFDVGESGAQEANFDLQTR